jgi:hypothetical protein
MAEVTLKMEAVHSSEMLVTTIDHSTIMNFVLQYLEYLFVAGGQ